MKGENEGNIPSKGTVRRILLKNFASIIENYISGTIQFINSREEVTVKKAKVQGKKSKIKENEVTLNIVFLIF